ncbi:MAG: hypothetical protein IJF67_12810, partial [Clostridia bacterium]|nr:hypothetical protein [Clostridia bacterium]
MKKHISALILIAMLASLAACGGETPSTDTTAPTSLDITLPPETELTDNLPNDLDFNGEKVTFLYREELLPEFYTEEETGDVVDAAVYSSMISVEERLNVDIVVDHR